MSVEEKQYPDFCDALKSIYLEDSYVLEINISGNFVSFVMDFVILENHELYQPPKVGEQYCFRKGLLKLLSFSAFNIDVRDLQISTDANGDKDLGNIDSFLRRGDTYFLEGSWGNMKTKCEKVMVQLENDENTP